MDRKHFLISILTVVFINLILYLTGTPLNTIVPLTPVLLLGCGFGTLLAYNHFHYFSKHG